jgi:tape measure domain-containing protein
MPTLRELITKVGFNVDDRALNRYDQAIGRIYQKADGLYSNLNRVADNISGIGRRLTFMLSAPLAGIGIASVMAQGKVEQFNTSFETMLGSAQAAKDLMSELFRFEAQTPFNLEQVMGFAQQLLIAKEPAANLTKQMMLLGNVAAGDGERMGRIVYVLGQVRALGYLQGQDIMQFTNALVPIREALTKTLNVTGAQLQRMIEKRQITAQMTQRALEWISGSRTGLMEKQSKTLLGLWSSLGSAVFRLRVALGQLLVDEFKLKPLAQKFIDLLNKISTSIDAMPKWLKRLIVWVGLFLFALGPATWALGAFLKLFLLLRGAMAVIGFTSIIGSLGKLIPLLWKGAAAMAAMTWQIALIAAGLAALFIIAEDIWGYFHGKDSVIIPGLKAMLDWYLSYSDKIWAMWKSGFDDIVAYFKEIWTEATDWFTSRLGYQWLEKAGAKIHQWTQPAANAAMPKLWSASPSSMAMAGAGPQINVNVGNVTVPVPAGTPKEQQEALRTEAYTAVKMGIIDQVKWSMINDIQSGTRR